MIDDGVRIPGLADIEEARVVLDGVSVYTPMEESRWLSALAGGRVLIKAENLQRTGSFKIRGAYLRMSRLSDDEKAAGVVAASAGNHAQGVALAAQMLGSAPPCSCPRARRSRRRRPPAGTAPRCASTATASTTRSSRPARSPPRPARC